MRGLDPAADVRLIAVGAGAQAAQALRSGQITAYAAPKSQVAQLEGAGLSLRSLPLPARLDDLFGAGLFTRREALTSNRKTIVSVGRAVAKSTVFLLANPEAAIRLHWKHFPEQVPQGIEPAKALQDALRVVKVQSDGLRIGPDEGTDKFGSYRHSSLESMVDVFGWSKLSGELDRFFTNDLIAEINAFDRQAIVKRAETFEVSRL